MIGNTSTFLNGTGMWKVHDPLWLKPISSVNVANYKNINLHIWDIILHIQESSGMSKSCLHHSTGYSIAAGSNKLHVRFVIRFLIGHFQIFSEVFTSKVSRLYNSNDNKR